MGNYTLTYTGPQIDQAIADANSHKDRTDNPHGVTKSQIGLGNAYFVDDYAEAQALTGLSDGDQVSIAEEGRGGPFVYRTGDYTAEVTADTENGIYLPLTEDSTGASGCMVRNYSGAIETAWFSGNVQSALAVGEWVKISSDIVVTTTITVGSNKTIEFADGVSLTAGSGLSGAIIENADKSGGNANIKIIGGVIDGNSITTIGADFRVVDNLQIIKTEFKNSTQYGLYTYKITNFLIDTIDANNNGSASGFNYSGVGLNGSQGRIINSVFHNNDGNGLRYWHDAAVNTARLTFVGNTFRDNAQHGLLGNPEATFTGMSQIVLTGNFAYNNGAGSTYSGFAMHYSNQVSATGNIAYNNAEHGFVAMDGDNYTLSANIWRDNGGSGVRVQGDTNRAEDGDTGVDGMTITGDLFLGNGTNTGITSALRCGISLSAKCRNIKLTNTVFNANNNIALRTFAASGYTDPYNVFIENSQLFTDTIYNSTTETRIYYDNVYRNSSVYFPNILATGPLTRTRGMNGHILGKTSAYTLSVVESGLRITNAGAGAAVTITLPAATQGLTYSFSRTTSAHELRVDPDGTESVRGGGAGKYLIIAAGGSATLICINNGTWEFASSYGTHTYEP